MPCRLLAAVTVLALAGFVSAADIAPVKPANPGLSPTKPPTVKVEKVPFRVDVSLKGIFEPAATAEVLLKPEFWTGGFNVLTAVEPGTAVKRGDVLLTLDPEKIDRAIRDMEADQQLADLAIRLAELDLPIAERTAPLDMAAAERGQARAEEDLRKFLDVDKRLAVESAEFGLKNAQHQLEYAEEELKQLQKMYRKDLTEETEEIILKRQRYAVESAKFMLKLNENRREQSLNVELPRREQDMRDVATKAALAWEKARTTGPLGVNQKRLALEKAKYERGRAAERLANLKKDRELFTVHAPTDGVVCYGRCVQGQWPTASSLVSRLQKGGSIMGDEVFITIVPAAPATVRATVEEKDRGQVAVGAPCKVTPTAMPDVKLSGKIERIGRVPVGGSFEVIIALDSAPGDAILPSMTCSVKAVTYMNPHALTVPAVAVFDDEIDEDRHYVYKVAAGVPERRVVKLGKRSNGRAEIKDGLEAGDEILLAKP
jgi:multidrug efflux pump subunit AcrA (membrane-fusion protein)